MTQTPKIALAYTRTAKAEAGYPNESISHQKEAIYEFADENGHTIAKYVEHIRSGKCDDFRWLFNILYRNKKIKHLLIYSHDRLTRNAPDCIHLIWYLKTKYDITVETVAKSKACSLINNHTTNHMANQFKKTLCYIRSASTLPTERELSVAYQKDVIIPFALANGFDIVDFHNDFRADLDTDYAWLDEYFSNAHKTVQYILIFSIERLGRDVRASIEATKYLHGKYGVKAISALQPEMDFITLNPDDINKGH